MKFHFPIRVAFLAVSGLSSKSGASPVMDKGTGPSHALSTSQNNATPAYEDAIVSLKNPPRDITGPPTPLPTYNDMRSSATSSPPPQPSTTLTDRPTFSDRPKGYPISGDPLTTSTSTTSTIDNYVPPPTGRPTVVLDPEPGQWKPGHPTYNGKSYTRGAAMQWCQVRYMGLFDHIEIWGRNWPMSDIGPDGHKLEQALRHRLITFNRWSFERCHDNCDLQKFRTFQWVAKAHSVILSKKRVEQAIFDIAPKPDQALEIGKGVGHDLCSGTAPDIDGFAEGRWESFLEP
ncbi:hypothetical protein MBLNU457_3449t1 [Dothideomycetes sp. NU457]